MPHFYLLSPVTRWRTLSLAGLLLAALLWPGLAARAQAPAWQSAAVLNSDDMTITASVAGDNGQVYLLGYFTNTLTLGSTTLTSAGGTDVFVARYQPATNTYAWAQRAGGPGFDYAYDLALSGTSLYVAGTFSGATLAVGGTTLTNAGIDDAYVAKLTDAGTSASWVWARQVGGASVETGLAVAVSGNTVYLAGSFSSLTVTVGAATLTNAGASDVYVARLTDAGSTATWNWAQRAGGTGDDIGRDLVATSTGLYITGLFSSAAAVFGSTTLATAGDFDVYAARLTDAGSTGTWAWAQRAGGPGFDVGRQLSTTGSSVYVAGTIGGSTATFGATTLANAGTGTSDLFVARLSDAGSTAAWSWAQRAGGSGDDYPAALLVRGTSLYVAGAVESSPATFGSLAYSGPGSYDLFAARLADAGSTGSFAWVVPAGGSSADLATALVASGSTLYVVGTTRSQPCAFGTIALATPASPPAAVPVLAALSAAALPTATAAELPEATVYPNPAGGTATVVVPAFAGSSATLTLHDALGRVVCTAQVPPGPAYALSLAGVRPGVYALQVQAAGTAAATQRLVVE